MLRETPFLTQTPNLCPRTAVGQPEPVGSAAVLCAEALGWAGADSQHRGHSQVRSAWPGGEENVSGDRNAVKSSSF